MKTKHVLAAAAISAASLGVAGGQAHALPNCTTSVVYTWGTKYPTCNLHPPQRLHVYAISQATCSAWGGSWGGTVKLKNGSYATICYSVDY